MKKDKRVKTLLGLFLPEYWPEVRDRLKACKLLSNTTKAVNIDYLRDIEFVFERGDKMAVYREFIHALNNGMLRYKLGVVIVYLAEHSNLAENDDLQLRIKAIRQGFKRYRKNYS